MRKFLTFCLQNPCKNAKKQTGAGRKGVPACSGLFYQEQSSNEVYLERELFSTGNNVAYLSEKNKLFLKINKKSKCIYKLREMMRASGGERRAQGIGGPKMQFYKIVLAKNKRHRYNETYRPFCRSRNDYNYIK